MIGLVVTSECACVYSAYKQPVHGHVTTAVQSHSNPYPDESHDLHVPKEVASSSGSTTNNDQVMRWVGLPYLHHFIPTMNAPI